MTRERCGPRVRSLTASRPSFDLTLLQLSIRSAGSRNQIEGMSQRVEIWEAAALGEGLAHALWRV